MVNNKELKSLERKFHRQRKKYFFPLANAYREYNNLDKCVSLFRQGISAFPQYWAARVALGRALMERGDLDEALEELESAIDQVPENLLLHRLLALIYFKKDELSKAATYCRLVLFVIPDDRECLFIMSEISKMKIRGFQTASILEETKRFSSEQWQPEHEQPEHKQPEHEQPGLVPEKKKEEEQAQQLELAQKKKKQEEQAQQTAPVQKKQEQKKQEQQAQQPASVQKKKVQEEKGQGEIVTPTIAELYLSQGFAEKALEIYQKLLIQQPDRKEWMERIHSIQKEIGIKIPDRGIKIPDRGIKIPDPKADDLSDILGVEHSDGPAEVLRQLEAWLENIEKPKVK